MWSSIGTLLVVGKASYRWTQLLMDWLRLASISEKEKKKRKKEKDSGNREEVGGRRQYSITTQYRELQEYFNKKHS